MKYMHFNSSCSYTALAMLLEDRGIDTEDTEIVMEEGLPWIFAEQDDCFCTGAMLQGKMWFDLYLNPRGLTMVEQFIEKAQLLEYLKAHRMSMLGLKLPGNNGKHAVVFTEYNGSYRFYNPVREGSKQNVEISLTEDELLQVADDSTAVGYLKEHKVITHPLNDLLKESISALHKNYNAIEEFSLSTHTENEYREAMDKLFRALLLDGITMLDLIGESELAQGFKGAQRDYMDFMRGSKTGRLADAISLDILKELVEKYALLIRSKV